LIGRCSSWARAYQNEGDLAFGRHFGPSDHDSGEVIHEAKTTIIIDAADMTHFHLVAIAVEDHPIAFSFPSSQRMSRLARLWASLSKR